MRSLSLSLLAKSGARVSNCETSHLPADLALKIASSMGGGGQVTMSLPAPCRSDALQEPAGSINYVSGPALDFSFMEMESVTEALEEEPRAGMLSLKSPLRQVEEKEVKVVASGKKAPTAVVSALSDASCTVETKAQGAVSIRGHSDHDVPKDVQQQVSPLPCTARWVPKLT